MSVNPGFGGQTFIPRSESKIRACPRPARRAAAVARRSRSTAASIRPTPRRVVAAGADDPGRWAARIFRQPDLAERRSRDLRAAAEAAASAVTHGALVVSTRPRPLRRNRQDGRRLLRELLRVVRGGAHRPAADARLELSRDGTGGRLAAGDRGALRVSPAGAVRRRARGEDGGTAAVAGAHGVHVRGACGCDDGAVAASGSTVHAALDARGRPCRLPARVREVFA